MSSVSMIYISYLSWKGGVVLVSSSVDRHSCIVTLTILYVDYRLHLLSHRLNE